MYLMMKSVLSRKKHKKAFDELPPYYSHLYMAIGGKLAAVLLIEDPLRPQKQRIQVEALRSLGIKNIVMMTGDSERQQELIAEKVGVDRYFSEVLPEDKAGFVERERLWVIRSSRRRWNQRFTCTFCS